MVNSKWEIIELFAMLYLYLLTLLLMIRIKQNVVLLENNIQNQLLSLILKAINNNNKYDINICGCYIENECYKLHIDFHIANRFPSE